MQSVSVKKLFMLFTLVWTMLITSAAFSHAGTIGAIITRDNQFYELTHKALLSFMAQQGQSKQHKFILQRPHADPIAIKNAARKLAAFDVDAIVTYGATATLAAIEETSGIPIIYAGVYEDAIPPKMQKRAAGVCAKLPISSLMRYLNTALDKKSIAVLFSSHEEDTVRQLNDIKRIAEKYGFSVLEVDLKKPADITTLLSGIESGALITTSSSIVSTVFPTIVRTAKSRNIPIASLLYHDPVTATIQLTPNPQEHGLKVGERLLQVLKGKSLKTVSSQCLSDIELIFNVREARILGIRIPMDLVTEATQVIY